MKLNPFPGFAVTRVMVLLEDETGSAASARHKCRLAIGYRVSTSAAIAGCEKRFPLVGPRLDAAAIEGTHG